MVTVTIDTIPLVSSGHIAFLCFEPRGGIPLLVRTPFAVDLTGLVGGVGGWVRRWVRGVERWVGGWVRRWGW